MVQLFSDALEHWRHRLVVFQAEQFAAGVAGQRPQVVVHAAPIGLDSDGIDEHAITLRARRDFPH